MPQNYNPTNDSTSPKSILLELTQSVRSHIIILSIVNLACGGLEAAFLFVVAQLGFAITNGDSVAPLFFSFEVSIFYGIGLASILISLRLLFSMVGVRTSMELTKRVTTRYRMQATHTFLRSSWNTQKTQSPGSLQQLVVDIPNQISVLTNQLAMSFGATLTLMAMVVLSLCVDPIVTSWVFALLIVLFSILDPLRKRVSIRTNETLKPQANLSDAVAEMSSIALEIKVFGVTQMMETRMKELVKSEGNAQKKLGQTINSSGHFFMTMAYISILLVLGGMTTLSVAKMQTTSTVLLIVFRMLNYGNQSLQGRVFLAQLRPLLQTFYRSTQAFETNRAFTGNKHLDSFNSIEFENVNYSYTADAFALKDVNFKLEQGETYGVIGPSGSGKSTLIQLLLGLLTPCSGTITVNGIDLLEIGNESWTERVAFVPQDSSLVSGTIADNIRFFREGISLEQMINAARSVDLLTEILAMPSGFDTFVGDRAQELSGGQRQRLSIARALIGNPELLILDEPTSALDIKSESIVKETIAALAGKTTVIVIAHRLSTLQSCSKIMIIKDGEVNAFDNTSNLISSNEYYRDVLRLSELI